MKPHGHRRLASRVCGLLIAALAAMVIASLLAFEARVGPPGPPVDPAAARDVLFTCPDGRVGLHVVHTRFLIGQARPQRPVLFASRLYLLRSFLVPNLNAQTSQRFLVYAAHDPRLSAPVLQAMGAALAGLTAPALSGPETDTVNPTFSWRAIFDKVKAWDSRAAEAAILITSRVDLDDLAHVSAAAAVQAAACAAAPPAAAGLAARMVYMDKGMLWYPSAAADQPYGRTCEWKNAFRSHLAIMQSLALVASRDPKGRALLSSCTLSVYSYPHYKPAALEGLRPRGCGRRLAFSAAEDVVRWRPPGKDVIGCLYSKTASSWSYGKLQHKGLACKAAEAGRLGRLFGATPQRLAAVNAIFAGLEEEAVRLVSNSTKQHLE